MIYGPVWVNEFSPRESNTKWMAILHSFVVIGVMSGYIVGAIAVNVLDKLISWRFAFTLQGYFMILIGICFIFSDNAALDIFDKIKKINEKIANNNIPPFEFQKEVERESSAVHGVMAGNETPIDLASKMDKFERISNLQIDHRRSLRMDTLSIGKNEFYMILI